MWYLETIWGLWEIQVEEWIYGAFSLNINANHFFLHSSDPLPRSKFQNADGYNQGSLEREANGVGNCGYYRCCCDTNVLGHSIWGIRESYKWLPQENVEDPPECSQADARVPEGKLEEEGSNFEEAEWDFWEDV